MESRGAFVPCRPCVTTWCTTSLSRPGTESGHGEPGLWGWEQLGCSTCPPHHKFTSRLECAQPFPAFLVPLLCVELWVGAASGNIHTSPEMLPRPPRLSQDTEVV